ncbi:MAG: hypothetical protein K6F61_07375 [Clostridiales bacterium]|nr:hypothetical protein [Bacillota bacterium]MBR2661786.1 hypothetical protein [Clostridia bacterium]MCR5566657.1 hypothetical protein [Clostridiales bacterium]
MKEGSRANALLVELLLVIFFFMISAAILVQVFADAKLKSRTAHATNASMLEAQNVAEDLYVTDSPAAVLNGYGFNEKDGVWTLEKDGYLLRVTILEEETDSGILRKCDVSGVEVTHDQSGAEKESTLLTIPSTRYIQKEVSP